MIDPLSPLPDPTPHPARTWRRRFRRTLLTGLAILVPAVLTAYVLKLLFDFMDGIFAPVVNHAVCLLLRPAAACEDFHIPGLGLVMTFLVVLLLGWLSSNVGGRRGIQVFEKIMGRIPVAKSVYGATKGVFEALSHEQAEAFKRVVLVEYPKAGVYVLAFVTRAARWPSLHPKMADLLLVFVPTTPNPTSGFLLLVPREEAIPAPMSVEEGIRMVISGGILLPDVEALLKAKEAATPAPAVTPPRAPAPSGDPAP